MDVKIKVWHGVGCRQHLLPFAAAQSIFSKQKGGVSQVEVGCVFQKARRQDNVPSIFCALGENIVLLCALREKRFYIFFI